jgi:integrase
MTTRKKVTEHWLRTVKPAEKARTVADDGLQVEIQPTGRVVFYHKFREGGRQTRERLGEYNPEGFNLKAARARVRELQAKLVADEPVAQSSMTLAEFIDGPFKVWVSGARVAADETLARLTDHFVTKNPAIGATRLKNLQHGQIELWKTSTLQRLKPASVNRALGDLKKVLQIAVDFGHIRRSPAAGVKMARVDEERTKLLMSDDEFKRFTKAVESWNALSYFGSPTERHQHPVWFVIFLRLAINTGGRKGELLKLRWDDIDQEERMITFHGVNPKTRRTRRVPISDQLLTHLQTFNAERRDDEEDQKLFPVADLRKPWERFVALAKLPELTPHDLRHHVASTLVLRGVALSVVMKILGHTNLHTTQRYLSVRTNDAMDALNLL